MAIPPVKVGLIGCGVISGIYLQNACALDVLQVVACADLIPERAQARAAEYGVPKTCSVEELLADPEIEVILNLTIPNAHYGVAMAALEAGKSVYNEKPLAIRREEAQQMLTLAARKGLRVGCAPDTFLGAGLQTSRKLIDDGGIGPVITSFDVWGAELPRLEIYGTEGSLSVPDPNTFGGPVRLRRAGEKEWTSVELTHGFAKNSRGIGLADMAYAIRFGRPHRASGELAYHVLDVMHAFHDASREGRHVEIASQCQRPAALPVPRYESTLEE